MPDTAVPKEPAVAYYTTGRSQSAASMVFQRLVAPLAEFHPCRFGNVRRPVDVDILFGLVLRVVPSVDAAGLGEHRHRDVRFRRGLFWLRPRSAMARRGHQHLEMKCPIKILKIP